MPSKLRELAYCASLLSIAIALPAHADDASPVAPTIQMAPAVRNAPIVQLAQSETNPDSAKPAASAPTAPAEFWDTFTIGAEIEAGITGNPDQNHSGVSQGQLFTDKVNQLLLNQATLTFARPFDPKATDFDWGFRVQGLYGSDARYTHFLGELDKSIKERGQLDVLEASLSAHLPYLTSGGTDVKFGQYPTPIGFEVIEPSGNPFYSHSYIFNYGIPLKHTGGYLTTHVNDMLDIWLGGDTGVNTTLDKGDNNKSPAFIGGFGLNGLLDGKLTVLALTHVGPENPEGVGASYNGTPIHVERAFRYLNDVVITYKPTDALTLVTEANFIRDEGFHANGWGVAQYLEYAINDNISANFRAEIYRDGGANSSSGGFYVGSFPHNQDFVNVEYGLPNGSNYFYKATYSEFTAGVTYKPDVPDIIKGTEIRPEVRIDRSLTGVHPYKDGTSHGQFTAALDVIVPISLYAAPTPAAAPPAPPPPPPPPAPPEAPAPKPEAQRQFQVFFDFDKSAITPEAASTLAQAADSAKAGNVVHIKVTGHTDTVGSVRYNLKLSQRRAAAVKKTLVGDGLPASEINTLGVGKTDLLVPTPDGVREPQNRRATIEFE